MKPHHLTSQSDDEGLHTFFITSSLNTISTLFKDPLQSTKHSLPTTKHTQTTATSNIVNTNNNIPIELNVQSKQKTTPYRNLFLSKKMPH